MDRLVREPARLRVRGSDVAFEDGGFGETGEALADASGSGLADAAHGLEIVVAGGQELLETAEVVDQALDHQAGQAGDLGQQAEAAGADLGVQSLAAGAAAEDLGHGLQVDQIAGGELVQVGQRLDEGARALYQRGVREIVADDQFAFGVDAGDQLVELQGEQPSVGAELDDISLDLLGDPADHLQPLYDGRDVADRHQVLDLQRGERPGDLVEPVLVPFERRQGLVRLGEDHGRLLQDVPDAVQVEGDDPHRLADRDDREPGLPGHPLRGPVPRPRLVRRNRRIGNQVYGRTHDLVAVAPQHDGAVHLGQFPQPGRREVHVELEPATADLLDHAVVPQHDQPTGGPAQNPLQPITQSGPRGQFGQDHTTTVVQTFVARHLTPVSPFPFQLTGAPP